MSDTTYVDYVAPAVSAEWLNEINDHVWHDTPVHGTAVHDASRVSNTPAGTITATNVQSALNEIVSDLADQSGASLVGFLPVGSGAVVRTVEKKLQDFVSVKDFGKSETLIKSIMGVSGDPGSILHVNGFHTYGDGAEGTFYWDASANKNTHNGGSIIDPSIVFPTDWTEVTQRTAWFTASGVGSGVWKRTVTDVVNLKWFGAIGDNTQDNKESINKFIAVWIVGMVPGYIPNGTYMTTDRVLFNVALNPARRLPLLYGDGAYSSLISSTAQVGPVFHIYGSAAGPDHFQGKLSRIGFACDAPTIGFAIGLGDYSDNHGNYEFDQVFWSNSNSTSNSGATTLQLNWLFDCHFTNCVTVGKPNKGTSLQCRNVQFTQFDGGSYSNAYFGILINDGQSYNVTFNTPDIENVNFGLYVDSIYAEFIKYNNGYMDIWDPVALAYPTPAYPFYIGGVNYGGVSVENVHMGRAQSYLYSGTPGAISPSSTGLGSFIMRGFYSGQTTPAVLASDVAKYNRTGQIQRVRVYPAGIITIFINGVDTGETKGEFTLLPNEYIALRYSSTPVWSWKAIP